MIVSSSVLTLYHSPCPLKFLIAKVAITIRRVIPSYPKCCAKRQQPTHGQHFFGGEIERESMGIGGRGCTGHCCCGVIERFDRSILIGEEDRVDYSFIRLTLLAEGRSVHDESSGT